MPDQTTDRRSRHTFWIDDRILDDFSPILGRFAIGPAAIAVYAALARRADRDGDSWPRMRSIAAQAATSPSTVRRAIRLLEALGLLEVASRYERGSNRQTSNLYTLLTPPAQPPPVGEAPETWPTPQRRVVLVEPPGRPGVLMRAESVADARRKHPEGSRPTPSLSDRGVPVPQEGAPVPTGRGAPVRQRGHEGHTVEGQPREGGSPDANETTTERPPRSPFGVDGRRIARALQAAAADPARPPYVSAEHWARSTGALQPLDTVAQAGDWERWQEFA